MNKPNMFQFTKGAVAAIALSTVAAGCFKSEAERFGYKGEDLLDLTNMTWLVMSPMVTNWVPERVLTVYERYDLTDDEKRVVEIAGVLMPGVTYDSLPEGYFCESKEPWFSLMTTKKNSFGFDGVAGILAHQNPDSHKWETSESYFSSYWESKEKALEALKVVEAALDKSCNVKKFHRFADCWIAEYVRLSVVGVVGRKADGKWSCMLSIRDKNGYGPGPWVSVEEQQARLNRYIYMKELRAWKKTVAELWVKNAKLVADRAKELGLPGFTEETQSMDADNGMKYSVVSKTLPMLKKGDDIVKVMEKTWEEQLAGIKKAIGVEFNGEIMKEAYGEGEDAQKKEHSWSAIWRNKLYEVSLEISLRPAFEVPAADAEGEENVTPPEGGYCRISFAGVKQPEIDFPAQPELKE